MTAIEDQIRDKLAERLNLIEDGLKLIQKNFHLPNSQGARGYIDILARDRHGTFVAIELKRSNKTAREALHEIFKYKELLQVELGVEAAEVASMIISTHWHELLTPFTRLKRSADASIRGFKLDLREATTTPVAVTEILPAPEPPQERGTTPVHVLFTVPRSPMMVSDLWTKVTRKLQRVGVDDAIGLTVSHPQLPVGLYVALGRALEEDPRTVELDYLREVFPDDSIEAPEGFVLEYRALDHILEDLSAEYTFELFYPERLASVIDLGDWQIEQVWRQGIFAAQRSLYPDDEILDRITDSSGHITVRAYGSARLEHTAAWGRARRKITASLLGNEEWSAVAALWLHEAQQNLALAEVGYQVYNPNDIITSLVYGWPDALSRFMPKLELLIKPSGEGGRILTGILGWNGVRDIDIIAAVSEIYSSLGYLPFHTILDSDDEARLLARWGLSYKCLEFYENDAAPAAVITSADGLELARTPLPGDPSAWVEFRPLSEFFRAYNVPIDQLVQSFRSSMYIDLSAGFQMVTRFGQNAEGDTKEPT